MAKRARSEAVPPESPKSQPHVAETELVGVPGGAATGSPRKLDRLIHERIRLGIVSALAVTETLSFTELRELLGATDGNLSVHARKLEGGGYIECTKTFEDRVPKTRYRLTAEGRRALENYIAHMEALIDAVRRG